MSLTEDSFSTRHYQTEPAKEGKILSKKEPVEPGEVPQIGLDTCKKFVHKVFTKFNIKILCQVASQFTLWTINMNEVESYVVFLCTKSKISKFTQCRVNVLMHCTFTY